MSKVSRILGPEAPTPSKPSQEAVPRPRPRTSTVRPKSTSYKDVDPERASLSSRRSGRSSRATASKSNMTFLFSDDPNDPSPSRKVDNTTSRNQQVSRNDSVTTNGTTDKMITASQPVVNDNHEPPIEVFPSRPHRKTSKLSLTRLFSRSKRNDRPPEPPLPSIDQSQNHKGTRRKKSNKLKKHASKESLNSIKLAKANKSPQEPADYVVDLPPLPPQVEKLKAREASPKRSASRLSQQAHQDARVSFDMPTSSSAGSVRSIHTDRTMGTASRSENPTRRELQQTTAANQRHLPAPITIVGKSKHSRYAANAPFQGQSILELSDSDDSDVGREVTATNRHSPITPTAPVSRAGPGNKRQKAGHLAHGDPGLTVQTSFIESASDLQHQSPMSVSSPRMTNSRASWVSNTSTVKQGRASAASGRVINSSRDSSDSRWMAVTPEEAAILAIIRRERGTEPSPVAARPPPTKPLPHPKQVANRNAFAQQTSFRDEDSSESGDEQMPLEFPAPPRADATPGKVPIKEPAGTRTKVTDLYVDPGTPGAWPTPSPSTENEDSSSILYEEDERPTEEQDATSDLPKMPSSMASKANQRQRQSRLPVASQSTWLGSPGPATGGSSTPNETPIPDSSHIPRSFSKPYQRNSTIKVNRDAVVARNIAKFEANLR